MQHTAFLLLGSNLGDRMVNLATARWFIGKNVGQISDSSSIYETGAWGKTDQPDFLNQVIIVNTHLSPQSLMTQLLNIESEMGRERSEKWGERIIDLDILFYDKRIVAQKKLTIPHPGIPTRRFTLCPLQELAPDFIHPVENKTIAQLLNECQDPLLVKKVN